MERVPEKILGGEKNVEEKVVFIRIKCNFVVLFAYRLQYWDKQNRKK